jgi:hypothetical protein
MNIASAFAPKRSAAFGAALFLATVLVGATYIVWAKLSGVHPVLVTGIPLMLMVLYALTLGLARYFRLRDDQAGDNVYYLGFLYTLTSLGVSLWQFAVNDGAESIVTNFGIAIASTILGVAFRVVFNQMRQDPLEVEHTARLELADAARRVKQELGETTLEFANFRRASQQMFGDGLIETRQNAERLANELFDAIRDFPDRLAEPLNAASRQSMETTDRLATALAARLEDTGTNLSAQAEGLKSTAEAVAGSLAQVHARLTAMQTPDNIIEVKLQPFISGFTQAVNNQSKATTEQMADLQRIISQFNEHVHQLAEHMSQIAHSRSEDQKLLQALVSKLDAGSAETRRLLTEIDRKLSASTLGTPLLTRLLPGWLRGSA